jgi:hypothetical protein
MKLPINEADELIVDKLMASSTSSLKERSMNNGDKHLENQCDITVEFISDKCKEYYLNGELHRLDGPAIEYVNGDKEYWLNNVRIKKEDLSINKWPKCTINGLGNKEWMNEKGEYHREDGPAIEWPGGNKYWYINNKLHREDGPAIEFVNGTKEWYRNGLLHREDGPAFEGASGNKEYYLNGMPIKKEDLLTNKWPKCILDEDGNKNWRNEKGELHREDGPAVEQNCNKYWYINDKRHREDGPAVEKCNGDKAWFINGLKHREDGPAIEYADGDKEWWANGKLHRLNGPAVEYSSGDKYWYKNGKRHREDGPAVEYSSGYKDYFLNDRRVSWLQFWVLKFKF